MYKPICIPFKSRCWRRALRGTPTRYGGTCPLIPALGWLRQEDLEFKLSQDYIARAV
jgi:hypothetical protein